MIDIFIWFTLCDTKTSQARSK